MKQISLIFALLTVITLASAQDRYDDEQMRTIFSKNRSNGVYGAFSIGWSQINGKDAFVSGGRAAFIFDHSLAIGIGGQGFVNNLDYHSWNDNIPEYTLAGGYGGFVIEPIVEGKKPVHLSFPVLVGIGAVVLTEDNGWGPWDQYPYAELDHDLFFIIEPAAELEFNMTRWFRLAASLRYRYTSKIDLMYTPGDALRGLSAGLTFKFGKF